MTYTRTQYMGGVCTHEQYYSQLVTPEIVKKVVAFWGGQTLREAFAIDSVFNNLPLPLWDSLARSIVSDDTKRGFRDLGDWETLGGLVCVVKQAARNFCRAPEIAEVTLPEAIEFMCASGISVLVIDEDTDFDKLPPFASLFPDLVKKTEEPSEGGE